MKNYEKVRKIMKRFCPLVVALQFFPDKLGMVPNGHFGDDFSVTLVACQGAKGGV